MAKTNLGRVSLVPSGEYDSSANYKKLDVVSNDGSMYICKKDCIGVPTDNEEYWLKAVQKGDTGEQGPMPVNGVDYNTTEEKETFKNEVAENATKEVEENIEKIEEEAINNFNTNATTKTNAFDTNAAQKTTDFNTNATNKTNAFNTNSEEKTNTFNQNYEQKMQEIENASTSVAEERTTSNSKYARALKREVSETDFTQIYAENNKIDNLKIYGAELTQETRVGYNQVDSKKLTTFNNGTYISSTNYSTEPSFELESNIEYIITSKANPTDAGVYLWKDGVSTKATLSRDSSFTDKNVFRFNSGDNTGLSFYIGNLTSGETTLTFTDVADFINKTEFMILKASFISNNILPAYEQYGASPSLEYPSEVQKVNKHKIKASNKNIIDTYTINAKDPYTFSSKNGIVSKNGIDFIWNEDGSISVKGTSTEMSELILVRRIDQMIKSQRELTLNGCPEGGSSNSYRLAISLSGFPWTNYNDYGKGITCSLLDGKSYDLRLSVYAGQTVDLIFKPMIQYSSITSEYEKHEGSESEISLPESQFNGVIGNYKDSLKKIDGVFKLEKYIKEIIITGTEKIILANESEEYITYGILQQSTFFLEGLGFCNYLKHAYKSTTELFNILNNYLYLKLPKSLFPTVEELKTWLSEKNSEGTPLKVYGVLQSPEYIELSDELQDILNNLEILEDFNNITIDNGTFEFIYNKSLIKEFEEKDENIVDLVKRVATLENAILNS